MTSKALGKSDIAILCLLALHVLLSLASLEYRLLLGGIPAAALASLLGLSARGGGDVIPGQTMAAFRLINWVLFGEAMLLLLALRLLRLGRRSSDGASDS